MVFFADGLLAYLFWQRWMCCNALMYNITACFVSQTQVEAPYFCLDLPTNKARRWTDLSDKMQKRQRILVGEKKISFSHVWHFSKYWQGNMVWPSLNKIQKNKSSWRYIQNQLATIWLITQWWLQILYIFGVYMTWVSSYFCGQPKALLMDKKWFDHQTNQINHYQVWNFQSLSTVNKLYEWYISNEVSRIISSSAAQTFSAFIV